MNRRLFSAISVLMLSGYLVGCSQRAQNAPVDAETARDTLKVALESWKNGDAVDALQKASPPIYVVDAQWQSGAKLVDFKLVNDGECKDANLFCPVQLSVKNAAGKVESRQVTYIIATAPNLAVSRKLF
jgi:hypothetical protein